MRYKECVKCLLSEQSRQPLPSAAIDKIHLVVSTSLTTSHTTSFSSGRLRLVIFPKNKKASVINYQSDVNEIIIIGVFSGVF